MNRRNGIVFNRTFLANKQTVEQLISCLFKQSKEGRDEIIIKFIRIVDNLLLRHRIVGSCWQLLRFL